MSASLKELERLIEALTPGRHGVIRSTPDVVHYAQLALPSLVALLTEHKAMREWILTASHTSKCRKVDNEGTRDGYADGHLYECTCGLSALRESLKDLP